MPSIRGALRNERITAYLMIVLGCVIGGAAYPLFLSPNHIAPGGLTGLAMVINYIWPAMPVGITSLVLNVPLFLIAYRSMGRTFAFRSLIATVLFSLMIDILPLRPMVENDPLLGSLFGGVLLGIGLGLILRGGATTGGTDMVARMLHKRFQHITVGAILFGLDCAVVILAAITMEVRFALCALICLYVSDRLIDTVMLGISHDKACYIISSQQDAVKAEIMTRMERGVTVLSAQGGYTGEPRPVLLCVLSAQEVTTLKAIVRDADPRAFLFISDAHEVLGEGFRNLSAD